MELAGEMTVFFERSARRTIYLCFQFRPSALIQCSPESVVISKTGGNGTDLAGGVDFIFAGGASRASCGEAAETVTVWVAEPTGKVRFATAGLPDATGMPESC